MARKDKQAAEDIKRQMEAAQPKQVEEVTGSVDLAQKPTRKKKEPGASPKQRERGQGITAGTYLSGELADALEDIANEYPDMTEHRLRQIALEWFVKAYRAGTVKIGTTTEAKNVYTIVG
jgi:hypothetical protein